MHFRLLILLVTLMPVFAACSSDDEPTPDPTERTVLVYMVANNSLGSGKFDTADLNEMVIASKEGTLPANARLLVYHHAYNSETPKLMELTEQGWVTLYTYDTSELSVSSSRMNRVIADVKQMAPALRYGIILWSHGSGWLQNGMELPAETSANQLSVENNEVASPLSFGDDGRNYMNVSTLADVLRGKGFDYAYFDCCYMAGVEVVYELRDCVDKIVASCTEIPANGMPYDSNLPHLMAYDANLVAAATNTFACYNGLIGEKRTCTISVIDTSALDELAAATRNIYSVATGSSEQYAPQRFMTSDCTLFDFGQYVADLARDAESTLLDAFNNALNQAVVYKASTPRVWNVLSLNHHSGLSTFITEFAPSETYYNKYNYATLQWAADVAASLPF